MKHKVAIGNISAIVSDFIDQVLMPEAQKSGWNDSAFHCWRGKRLRSSKLCEEWLITHINVAKTLGVVDAENMIDVDMALKCCAIEVSPDYCNTSLHG